MSLNSKSASTSALNAVMNNKFWFLRASLRISFVKRQAWKPARRLAIERYTQWFSMPVYPRETTKKEKQREAVNFLFWWFFYQKMILIFFFQQKEGKKKRKMCTLDTRSVLLKQNESQVMNFFLYVFYRLKSLYKFSNPDDSWIYAFTNLGALIMIHILTVVILIRITFNMDLLSKIRIDNGIKDRFILFPLLISPIYICLFLYFRKNKTKIIQTIAQFSHESEMTRKRNGRYVLCYLAFSLFVLFFATFSPLFFD